MTPPLRALKKKAVVGGFFRPVVAKIIALEPDLVILGDLHEKIAARLKARGIPVFVYRTRSVAGSLDTISTFGTLMGKEMEAQKTCGPEPGRI